MQEVDSVRGIYGAHETADIWCWGGGQEKDKSKWGVSVCRERPPKLSGSGIADRSNFIV